MPRLAPSLLTRARNLSPLLPLLLQTCRTLPSAQNELRWLREHVSSNLRDQNEENPQYRALLTELCHQRARGVPLQYLLGSQPFGELEILCRPGVLIPRPETEAYTAHLASLILEDPGFIESSNSPTGLRILDLCTGTGCIPLSLYALLQSKWPNLSLTVRGVDISHKALNLAGDNLTHNIRTGGLDPNALNSVSFVKGDVLSLSTGKSPPFLCEQPDGAKRDSTWDVLISNPPYISASGFAKSTTRSVRNYEPRLALVPPISTSKSEVFMSASAHPEDMFYPCILSTSRKVHTKLVLMEVADMGQAERVAGLAIEMDLWKKVEIWRDWPDQPRNESMDVGGRRVSIRGEGEGRSVVCWR